MPLPGMSSYHWERSLMTLLMAAIWTLIWGMWITAPTMFSPHPKISKPWSSWSSACCFLWPFTSKSSQKKQSVSLITFYFWLTILRMSQFRDWYTWIISCGKILQPIQSGIGHNIVQKISAQETGCYIKIVLKGSATAVIALIGESHPTKARVGTLATPTPTTSARASSPRAMGGGRNPNSHRHKWQSRSVLNLIRINVHGEKIVTDSMYVLSAKEHIN